MTGIADDLIDRFGLVAEEARRIAPIVARGLNVARVDAAELKRRGRRLDEINASLAIENLGLADPERAFFDFLHQFDLPQAEADAIFHAYSLARARSVSRLLETA